MTPKYSHGQDAKIHRDLLEGLIGKVVEIVDHDVCVDSNIGYGRTGMKARISNAISLLQPDTHAGNYGEIIAMLELDYTQFEDHNLTFEDSGWCDNNGDGDYTCRGLGLYTGRDICMANPALPLLGMKLAA